MKIKLTLLLTLLICGCSQEPNGFRTTEELKESFKTSFERGDLKAINLMVYWDDSPTKLKKTMEQIISDGAGTDRIKSIDVVPLSDFEYTENTIGKEIEPTLKLTHWLIVECKEKTDSPYSAEKQIGIGIHDERYFITGIRYKE